MFCQLRFLLNNMIFAFYIAPIGVQSIEISVSVCLSVCVCVCLFVCSLA